MELRERKRRGTRGNERRGRTLTLIIQYRRYHLTNPGIDASSSFPTFKNAGPVSIILLSSLSASNNFSYDASDPLFIELTWLKKIRMQLAT